MVVLRRRMEFFGGLLEQLNPSRSVLSAMLFVVVALPNRRHIGGYVEIRQRRHGGDDRTQNAT